jgi:hypothetical protein
MCRFVLCGGSLLSVLEFVVFVWSFTSLCPLASCSLVSWCIQACHSVALELVGGGLALAVGRWRLAIGDDVGRLAFWNGL